MSKDFFKNGTVTLSDDGVLHISENATVLNSEEIHKAIRTAKKVELSPGNKFFIMENGYILTKDKNVLIDVCGQPGQTVKLPGTIKEISNYALNDLDAKRVIFPQGLKTIGDNVLNNNKNLTSIDFLKGLTDIGKNSLMHNAKIKTMFIPGSVNTFKGCNEILDEISNKKNFNFAGIPESFLINYDKLNKDSVIYPVQDKYSDKMAHNLPRTKQELELYIKENEKISKDAHAVQNPLPSKKNKEKLEVEENEEKKHPVKSEQVKKDSAPLSKEPVIKDKENKQSNTPQKNKKVANEKKDKVKKEEEKGANKKEIQETNMLQKQRSGDEQSFIKNSPQIKNDKNIKNEPTIDKHANVITEQQKKKSENIVENKDDNDKKEVKLTLFAAIYLDLIERISNLINWIKEHLLHKNVIKDEKSEKEKDEKYNSAIDKEKEENVTKDKNKQEEKEQEPLSSAVEFFDKAEKVTPSELNREGQSR